jgi:sulfate-transporting ATPase
MAQQYVFGMHKLSKTYPGGKEVLKEITLQFLPGAKIGVLGYNGAGKSTLLRIMAGRDTEYRRRGLGRRRDQVGYLEQEPQLDPDKTVAENVDGGDGRDQGAGRPLQRGLDEAGRGHRRRRDDDPDRRAGRAAGEDRRRRRLGPRKPGRGRDGRAALPPADADVDQAVGRRARRVALCRLLLSEAGHAAARRADQPPRRRERRLAAAVPAEYPGTVVAVTHDRYFLDNVTGWILELDRGRGIPYEGNYSRLAGAEGEAPGAGGETRAGGAASAPCSRARMGARLRPGRQTKSKARIQAYDKLLFQEARKEGEPDAQIVIPPGERLGDLVIEARGLPRPIGDKLLFEDLSFNLPPGGIVGVIGPNGAGKTTLFRMITGQEKPDGGELRVGETVQLGYVDQSPRRPERQQDVWEEISEGADMLELGKRRCPAPMSRFNFKGGDQQKKVGQLSGGERNRVHLAKMLKSGATCCCSTSRPTTSTSTPCARWKRR